VSVEGLNALFETPWSNLDDLRQVLAQSLTYVCTYAGEDLVGYVNVVWDGGVHAFLPDPNGAAREASPGHRHRARKTRCRLGASGRLRVAARGLIERRWRRSTKNAASSRQASDAKNQPEGI